MRWDCRSLTVWVCLFDRAAHGDGLMVMPPRWVQPVWGLGGAAGPSARNGDKTR
jgi:hypothetical protein